MRRLLCPDDEPHALAYDELRNAKRNWQREENDFYFELNQKEHPSVSWRSHTRTEEGATSLMVIRRLGISTAN
jgi:hypothetical protein